MESTAQTAPASAPRRRRRRLTPSAEIWILVGALGVLAAVLLAVMPRTLDVLPPFRVPWPLLALVAYLAEAQVIHLHIRRSAHSFSMSEVPLAAGLVLVAPMELVVARLLGSAVALTLNRRQPPLKVAFNLAQFGVSTAIAVLIVHVAGSWSNGFGPLLWAGVLLAILADNLVGVVAVFLAISLAESEWQTRRVWEMLRIGTLVAMTNGSIALIGIAGAWERPLAILLLAIPLLTAWLAYRAYVSERQQHENLELLTESTRIFQRAPELDAAMNAVLDHARKMFRAERAEIYLLPRQRGDDIHRVAAGPKDDGATMASIGPTLIEPALKLALSQRRAIRVEPDTSEGAADRAYREALVAPLVGETGIIGLMVVADRLSEISSFDDTDLQLFELLANHTAVALENGRLEKSLTKVTELKDELRHQAFHDSLTGLANRSLFSQVLDERLASPEEGRIATVLFIDLDDFKLVNDTLGHGAGDQLLAAVGARISACLRDGDLAARLGGDEFAVLLRDAPDLKNSLRVAERLVASLEPDLQIAGTEVRIRASIGIAGSGRGADTADDVMRNADVAMYSAKAHGKGRAEVFDPQMHSAFVGRAQLTAELGRASAAREFGVQYQPIIHVPSRRIVGVEALVRWDHPQRGRLMPATFIPAAEESDVIRQIGRYVLAQACERVERWRHVHGNEAFTVSVNVSGRELALDSFVSQTLEIVGNSGVPSSSIVLELTETAMLDDQPASQRKLRQLRDAGIGISIDDFGTGYSSLSYLQQLPLTTLKIASDFVGVDEDAIQPWALANAIIALGRALELTVIAEGVETQTQLDKLVGLGCEYVQGYYFYRPLEAVAVDELLRGSASGGRDAKMRADGLPLGDRAAAS